MMKKLKNFRAIVVIDDFPNRLAERAVVGLLTLGARVLVAIPVGHEDEGRCLFDCWLSGLNAYGRLAMVANQISRESLSRSTIIGADWEGDSLFGSPYRVALVLGVHPRDHSKVVVTFKERMVSGGLVMFCSGGAPEDLADEVIEGLITPCLLPIIPTGRSRQVLGVFFLDDWRFLVSAGSNHQGN